MLYYKLIKNMPISRLVNPTNNYPKGSRLEICRSIPISDSKVVSSNYPKENIYYKCKNKDANIEYNSDTIYTDGDTTYTTVKIKKNILYNKDLTPIEKMDKFYDSVDCLAMGDIKLYLFKYKTMIFNKLVLAEKNIKNNSEGFFNKAGDLDPGISHLKYSILSDLYKNCNPPMISLSDYKELYAAAKINMCQQ